MQKLPKMRFATLPQLPIPPCRKHKSSALLANCCGPFKSKGAKRCFGHNYFHCKRCSMCKPGRHHGAGGCKALKKVGGHYGGKGAMAEWNAIVSEARIAV